MDSHASSKRVLIASSILGVIILVLFIKSTPGIFARKSRGSFEYVRAGVRLLDKGKYPDAVKYFEKAYEMSPENDVIRSGLAYAYSRYGVFFEESGDYGKAVECFTKAYDAAHDANALQNLALAYSKKALFEANNRDRTKAMEDFTKARETARTFESASRILGISLFNDGIKEYKAGREDIAALCLKQSLLAHEDVRVMESLGDIYYKERMLGQALFYWEKARRMNPGEKGLPEKLEKIAREMELARTEASTQSPHFEIRYEKGLVADAMAISEALEKAYLDVGGDLRYFPASKTVVFFYSQDNFKEIFKLPSAVRAFYDGNIRIPLPKIFLRGEDLARYIYHEYAHAVVSAKTKNNCPVWLAEGVAVWQEFKWTGASAAGILEKVIVDPQASIDSLDKTFAASQADIALDGRKDMRPYYLLAYSAVKYIVDNWGAAGLDNILDRIGRGLHAVNAIDDELLLSEKEFNERWLSYLRRKA